MPRTRPPRPAAAPADQDHTPERIRRAAVTLFREFGYHGTSVRALADAVGVEPPSLYHHFESKQLILIDLFDRIMDDLVEGMERALTSGASHADRLRDAIRFHVLFHVERQDEAFISRSELRSLTPENRARINAKRDRYEYALRDFLRSGVDAGEFTIDDVQLMTTAILVMCSGVAEWFADRGRLSGEQVADEYAGIALTLACAGGPPGASGTSTEDGAGAGGGHSHRPPGTFSRSHARASGLAMPWS